MDLGSWNGTYISHDEPMLEPVDFDSFLESLQNGDYSRGVEQTPILSTPSDNTDPVSEPPMKKRRRPRTIKSPGKEPIRRRPRKPPPGVESVSWMLHHFRTEHYTTLRLDQLSND